MLVSSFSAAQVTVPEPSAVFRVDRSFVQESSTAATCAYPLAGEQQGAKGTTRAWS